MSLMLDRYDRKYICILVCTIVFFIIGLAYDVTDYANYLDLYDASFWFKGSYDSDLARANGYGSDYIYALINSIFYSIGFSFPEFRAILTILCLVPIFYIEMEMTGNSIYPLALYMIFPMVFDIIQTRNFLLETLLFIGIYVATVSSQLKMLKFFACVFFAFFFHKSAIFFFPFFLIYQLRNSKYGRRISYLLVLMGICMPLYADSLSSLSIFTYVIPGLNDSSKFIDYASNNFQFRHITSWVEALFTTYILYRIYTIIKRNKENYNKYAITWTKITYELSLYLCMLLPIFPILQDLDRLLRDLLLPTFIVFYFFIFTNKDDSELTTKKIFFLVITIVYSMIICYVKFYHGLADAVLPDIMKNNFLLDLFL